MAENPDTWTKLEWVINEALTGFDEQQAREEGICGLTMSRTVADAIRAAFPHADFTDDEYATKYYARRDEQSAADIFSLFGEDPTQH